MSFRQRGNVLLVWACCFVMLIGGGYWFNRAQKSAREESAKIEKQKEDKRKADAERIALEQKIEQEKKKDVVQASLKAVDDALGKWNDAVGVAQVTSRINLATPVTNLQTIRRETESLIVPPCLNEGKQKLLEAMKTEIEGYVAFMADTNTGKYLAAAATAKSKELVDAYKAERAACPK